MKIVVFGALFLSVHAFCLAQISQFKRSVDAKSIPASIKYPGKAMDILQWTDSQGNHLLILSEMIVASKKNPLNKDAQLFAGHFLEAGGQWIPQWKIADFERNCAEDVGATFIPQSVSVTDLNKNTIAEISFMYRIYCTGGIDPYALKLIMYEHKKKYAIRGETLVKLPDQPVYGGTMTIDTAFKSAPKEFQQFAITQWERYRQHPLK